MSNCGIMLDTNVFNHLLDDEFTTEEVQQYCENIFITHAQQDELLATKDTTRKKALLAILRTVDPSKVATESAIWGVSRWGEAKWGTAGYHAKIKQHLDNIEKKPSNTMDALIGEAAIINKYILVTNDRNLSKIVNKLGGKTKDFRI